MSLTSTLRFVTGHPLNRRRMTRGLADWAMWQLRSRFNEGPLEQRWIEGTRLLARIGETGITGNLYTGLHEFEDMAFALHLLRPMDLFVDVGANSGSYTVLAGGVARARVLALEPVPLAYERLRANVALNGLGDRVNAINVAAGATNASVRLTADSDTTNHVLGPGETAASALETRVSRLDDMLAGDVPEMVKIDVEGYELPVIRGGERCFSASGANAVLVELNGSGTRYGWPDAEVAGALTGAGYGAYAYEPFSRTLVALGAAWNPVGNTLFIRDVERARARVTSARRFDVRGVPL